MAIRAAGRHRLTPHHNILSSARALTSIVKTKVLPVQHWVNIISLYTHPSFTRFRHRRYDRSAGRDHPIERANLAAVVPNGPSALLLRGASIFTPPTHYWGSCAMAHDYPVPLLHLSEFTLDFF